MSGGQLFVNASGWVLLVLLGVTVWIAYAQERAAMAPAAAPLLERLRPHYWTGYVIAALTYAHTHVSMTAGAAKGSNGAGLWFASAVLLLVLVQVLIGLRLKRPAAAARPSLRRWHVWTMAAIAAGTLAHIVLNSDTLHALAGQ